MTRVTWDLIKHSKQFYINSYRRVGNALIISMIINLLLGLGIYFTYFRMTDPDIYATNGITPPVKLTALAAPNFTSVPLLASEVDTDPDTKVIPQ